MPRNEKGEIFLNNGRGLLMVFLCMLWMVFWALVANLADYYEYVILADFIAICGISSWGLVPFYFFWKEEQRYPQ
jgi:hypothetical protein